jgi:hypothetical protein
MRDFWLGLASPFAVDQSLTVAARTLSRCSGWTQSKVPASAPKKWSILTPGLGLVGGNNDPDDCDAVKSSLRSLRSASARDSAVSESAEMLRDNIDHCTTSHFLIHFCSLVLQGNTQCRCRYAAELHESSGQIQSRRRSWSSTDKAKLRSTTPPSSDEPLSTPARFA